jgi:hypothetical protein
MQYHVIADTLARQMADELVLVNVATNKIFVANDTGARIWRAIEEGVDLESVVTALVQSAPDAQAAQNEIHEFLGGLQREGFVAVSK